MNNILIINKNNKVIYYEYYYKIYNNIRTINLINK